MILFVGSEEKGHFIREVAKSYGWSAEFVHPKLDIYSQVQEILQYPDCKVIVYDVEQYVMNAQEIADEIRKIQLANNAVPVIYAPGYNPKSDLVMHLTYQGIKAYIFSDNLTEKKEELRAAITGKTTDYFSVEEEPEEVAEKKAAGAAKAIGIAGAVPRMGTTTQAIQLVKYLMYKGYKACYIQMNNHGYVEELIDSYEGVEIEEVIGKAVYQEVEMYYKLEKLPEVLKRDYDYFVYDYGVFSDRDFNKISFLEKDLQIFTVGTKPGEFMKTYQLIENNFYNSVLYIFNFVVDDKQERDDIYELMAEKEDVTFFAPDCRDPFRLCQTEFYESLFPVKAVVETVEPKKGFFKKRKKRR